MIAPLPPESQSRYRQERGPRLSLAFFFAALLAFTNLAHAQAISISPSVPGPFDQIKVRVPEVYNDQTARQTPYTGIDGRLTAVTMSGNRITVVVTLNRSDSPAPQGASLEIPIGQFPTGSFEIEVRRTDANGANLGTVGNTSFNVAARITSQPTWNHTDLWWDPNESGWGLNIIHRGLGTLFITWFVYDESRRATWYHVSSGEWTASTQFRGTVYRTEGPAILACNTTSCSAPFDPSQVVRAPVGTMTLSFHPTQADVASATITIDGKTVNKALRRQQF